MSPTLAEEMRAHLRLAVLQHLDAAPGYALHQYVLYERMAALGLGVTTDSLRTELDWLAEQGLVRIEAIEGAYVPALTSRGQDVAAGRARVSGISRPRA